MSKWRDSGYHKIMYGVSQSLVCLFGSLDYKQMMCVDGLLLARYFVCIPFNPWHSAREVFALPFCRHWTFCGHLSLFAKRMKHLLGTFVLFFKDFIY